MRSTDLVLILATALSLSIGWGIRGNFGHETGAMVPGALAAMAAVLLSRREDWWKKIGHAAFFGALGWSFGGSISYMQVIGYTHSGDSASVLYGFASLFLIGFLWGSFGGAGTALPLFLDRKRMSEFYFPIITVFAAWTLQDILVSALVESDPQYRHADPLYWYDTDWLGVFSAMVAILVLAIIRRRLDGASSLILHLCCGWWVGFLLLVVALDLRMTPPRGDNWAGCLGMFFGMILYFQRNGLRILTWSALVAGFWGGFGFAGADLFKLLGLKTGWNTNWHSVLEQTYGLMNGIGIGVMILLLAKRLPPDTDETPVAHWTHPFAVGFVLIGITYLNLWKNAGTWTKAKAVPELLYGLSAVGWFNLAYLLIGTLIGVLLFVHARRPLPFVPADALGRGQLLYLVFLWWMIVGNFERAIVSFAPQRLITEGVIFLNGVICSALILLVPTSNDRLQSIPIMTLGEWLSLRKTALLGIGSALLVSIFCWGSIRLAYGDQFAGHAGLHIRFGSKATATKAKPSADKPHP